MQNYLNTLEIATGDKLTLDRLPKNNFMICLDWNTFMHGPQNKILESVQKLKGSENAIFILINKDMIQSDSLKQFGYNKFMF